MNFIKVGVFALQSLLELTPFDIGFLGGLADGLDILMSGLLAWAFN